jgi:hypothetical protein
VATGLLQSLVDATPQRLGQTYLQELYNDLHDREMYGKALYYTKVLLSEAGVGDLS